MNAVASFLPKWLLRIAIFAVPVFLLLPFVGIVGASFSKSGALAFPPSDWTLAWYRGIAPGWYDALRYSVWLGAATTALATAVGVPLALSIVRGRFVGRGLVNALCVAPLGVPTIVIAVAGFKFFMLAAQFQDIGLNGNTAAIVLMQAVFTFPLVVRAVIASFAHYDSALDEAAQSLGATPWQVFWRITAPLIAPGVIAGMLFAFVLSFDDVVVAWFMGDPGRPTMPVKLFNAMEVEFDNAITALSTLIVAFWAVLALVLNRFFHLERMFSRR
ncbi:ABC transporter permease [Caballeronia sp. LZ032]|uniref:ABC transporter permease n=1 Tax=Caballeronia sp. LZ032 TaxID=3038565 RepID=UPI00285BB02B|nr:ABC transporter permease [Caballeronia sp. LZ032]MDR5880715.1 ABC transporter permease [Caballeronia sp. LZ032]